MIRDRIVCGIADRNVQKKLLQTSNLNLTTCINICKAAELAAMQMKGMYEEKSDTVNVVRNKMTRQSHIKDCRYCEKSHEADKMHCPAFGKKCASCGKQNHFAAKCRASGSSKEKGKKKSHGSSRQKYIRHVHMHTDSEASDCDSSDESVLSVSLEGDVNTVDTSKGSPYETKIYANFSVKGQHVKIQLDTGASCNVMPSVYLPEGTKNIESKQTQPE